MILGGLSALTAMKMALVATIGIGVSGGLLAWRERPEPGAVPLAVLLACQVWWSATLFFQMDATGIGMKIFWVDVSWLGIAFLPVAWLLFSLDYTGYSQYVQPKYIALVSLVPVVSAVLGVTNDYHNLFYVGSTLVEREGTAMLSRSPGIWFWVLAGYTYLVGLLGVIPILQFVTSEINSFRGQSLAILVGSLIPWVTNALFLLDALPTAHVDPTPVAFSLCGIAYLGALTRFQLFGTSPAPIRPARRSVFDRMQEGAIVLDRHGHIVTMNHQAAAALDADPEDILGRPVEQVTPQLYAELGGQSDSGQTVFRPESGKGSRGYDVSVSQLTDTHGRMTGQIVTLHDITDHLRQQQRLEVLNRVFRHNIRTNTQVIVGNAEYLADHNSESKAQKVQENAMEIEEISEEIRTVLDIFEQGRKETQPVRLNNILRNSIGKVGQRHPDVTVECELLSRDIYVDSILDDVFSNLIANAAEHNTSEDPTVWVEVAHRGGRVEVVVRDNGPGIDEEELALIEDGTETPLKHGSGFGLAVIVWGTEAAGGDVTFEDAEPSGLRVTVDVPTLSRTGAPSTTAASLGLDGDPQAEPVETVSTVSWNIYEDDHTES